MYHISDCRKYTRCPRLFFYDRENRDKEKEGFIPFVRLDESMTGLVRKKLGITECFEGSRGDPAEKAAEASESFEWLVNARFEYDRLRVKIPFMHRNNGVWDLYFLYTGLFPRGENLQYYTSAVWVLQQCGYVIGEIRVVHLNGDYVRCGELDPQELFIVSESFYTSRNHPSVNIQKKVYSVLSDMTPLLDAMDACSEGNVPEEERSSRCSSRSRCTWYDTCFPEERNEPDDSVLTLIASRYRYDMKKDGIGLLKDVPGDMIEGTRVQYAQIMADRCGGTYTDQAALRSWLGNIHYPVTFLDFEWDTFAVPPYDGMKPYDVLPFEYSVHILHEDGTLTHRIFLAVGDDRREMAERLLKDIPAEGSLVAYNAEGAEKIRISELAAYLPEYSERLLDMAERMEDLQIPFENGIVYDVRMRGQWSLKVIMGMMEENSYRSLDIHEGMQAVLNWRNMEKNTEPEEAEKIRKDLEAYCGMDTYAMTVVYRWLCGLVE